MCSFSLGSTTLVQKDTGGCHSDICLLKYVSKLGHMDWLCQRTALYIVVVNIPGLMEKWLEVT